jgi:hypothetical protein
MGNLRYYTLSSLATRMQRERRGTPPSMRLVATFPRWAVATGVGALGFVGAVKAYQVFSHAAGPFEGFWGLLAGFLVLDAGLVAAGLRSEEARLARELRTARTGTPALRGLVLGRRQQMPFFARLFSTRLGMAAVLVAEGDRNAAFEQLAGGSFLMRGGPLDVLRDVVDADLERATGTSVGLERCVGRLKERPKTGNREADLYATHVLVKALLEQGDADGALELYRSLATSQDDDERVYATWLRVWFDLDAGMEEGDDWPPPSDGDLRMAALLARSHGAQELVTMLEERLASVAPAASQ